jgi:hypothetical protein
VSENARPIVTAGFADESARGDSLRATVGVLAGMSAGFKHTHLGDLEKPTRNEK